MNEREQKCKQWSSIHGDKIEESPEWNCVQFFVISHLLNCSCNVEPFRVKLRLETYQENLQSWKKNYTTPDLRVQWGCKI